MKILSVSHFFSPSIGCIESVSKMLAREFVLNVSKQLQARINTTLSEESGKRVLLFLNKEFLVLELAAATG